MFRWPLLFQAVVLSASIFPLFSRAESAREAADRDAKARFLNLHFFAEGDGMHMSPDLVKLAAPVPGLPSAFPKNWKRKWGLNTDSRNWPVGLFEVEYGKMKVGVLGCAVCHTGRAAGQFIPGLGNKSIDVIQLGQDVRSIETKWAKLTDDLGVKKSDEYRRLEASALKFASTLANPAAGNLVQGAVPVSFIRSWFYEQAGQELPVGVPRGQVKVPSLWGYGEKRKAGQFCDGYGDGELPGWAIAVELVGGQRPEVVRRYRDKIEAAENLFSDFLPPRYPFTIDRVRAERGRPVFQKNCAGCHGSYETDADGLPVYESPNWVSWDVVRTDPDRLDGNTEDFSRLVDRSPLNDLIRTRRPGRGYFAPRLNGIWARFPYLHNGSVPSIAILLTEPSSRPVAFSVRDVGERKRFDEVALGLTIPEPGSREEKKLLKKARDGDREVYFTGRPGLSNLGHAFHTDLPDESKLDLIEYLKTL